MAGEFVRDYLARQVETLQRLDAQVRADQPDAVHQLRVVTRRLRSLLATFEKVFDSAEARHLREELAWLTKAAGEARDTEVLHSRLLQRLDEHPRRAELDALRCHVDASLLQAHQRAHQALVASMESPRYRRLAESLDVFVADPPWTHDAFAPVWMVLPGCLRHDWRRLRRRVRQAASASDASEREAHLHEVRKAAKRMRYAAEAMTSAWGTDATRFAAAMETLQTVLGEQRDDVVADQRLQGLQAEIRGPRSSPVVALSARKPVSFKRAYRSAWHRANKKRLRRWFMRRTTEPARW